MPRFIHVKSTVWSALALAAFMIGVGELGADSIGVPTPLHVLVRLAREWYVTK